MNKPEAQQIATAIAVIRPDWLCSSLTSLLTSLPSRLRDKPARDVLLALAWLAYDPDQRTPRLLRDDGPWWNLSRLAGPSTSPATESVILTRCQHDEVGTRCPTCYPRGGRQGVGPTTEQRATMRAAINAGKDALKRRTIIGAQDHLEADANTSQP